MVTSLSQLRKNRSSMMDKITKDLDSGGKRNDEDNRFWKLSRDKSGTGSAVIRFLPPVNGDDLPWVKAFSYGFKGPTGKWYINESPSTIGEPDPVMEYNGAAYNSKDPARIEDAKSRKRRTQFISNILVVKDPVNPDNEGKVFLFKYGKKIHDMLVSKAKPEFEDEQSVLVWDIDEGCNLKLRIKTVADYPNYDSSEWAAATPLADSDSEIEAILEKCHKLADFLDPSKFKSYETLKKEFDRVMSNEAAPASAESRSKKAQDNDDTDGFNLDAEVKKAAQPARKVEQTKPASTDVDDDDDLDAFKKMLENI